MEAVFRRSKVIEDPTIDHADSLSAIKDQENKRPNLISHFLALVLLAFVEVGLLDALVSIAEDTSLPKLSKKAALLLGEILQLSNRVLPHTSGSRMQVSEFLILFHLVTHVCVAVTFQALRARGGLR